jgi:hypothetical protein
MAAAVPCAPASVQVVGELPDELLFQTRNWNASSASPMNEMLGRAEMPASCDLCIAHVVQHLSKPFKKTAALVRADFLDTRRRPEILCQHEILLFRTS